MEDYLGSAIRKSSYKDEYMVEKIDEWSKQVAKLSDSDIAITQP